MKEPCIYDELVVKWSYNQKAKAVCKNTQFVAMLSEFALVIYFSKLPSGSSSAPCTLRILTYLKGLYH